MGRAYDGKKRWTETVLRDAGAGGSSRQNQNGGGGGTRKRFSGRTVKLSQAMRRVDDETRAIVRNARLDALEGDALEEDDDASDGGAYVDEDESGGGITVKDKKARSRSKKPIVNKARRWKVKSLAQLVFEEHGAEPPSADAPPTYLSVAAGPSTRPPRRFCCVCGFFAPYACTRCGSRYCRAKCGDQHKESGCLKFGL